METKTMAMYKIVSFFLRGMDYEFRKIEAGITTKFSTFEDPIVEMIEDGSNGRSFGKKPRENNCWTLTKIDHHIILINFKLFIPGETKSCLFFEYKDNGTLEIWHRKNKEKDEVEDSYRTCVFTDEKIKKVLRLFENSFTNKEDEEPKKVNINTVISFFEQAEEIMGKKEMSNN